MSFTTSWDSGVWLLPLHVARSSVTSPSWAIGRTSVTPSTSATASEYDATASWSAVSTVMLADERSSPKSSLSVTAAAWAGLSGGSTR